MGVAPDFTGREMRGEVRIYKSNLWLWLKFWGERFEVNTLASLCGHLEVRPLNDAHLESPPT